MEVRIERLGARGDGIAETPDGAVYVAGTVPGDTVEVKLLGKRGDGRVGRIARLVTPGASRRPPACRHFGTCGGCALQHVDTAAYLGWKRDRIAEALKQHGIAAEIGDTASVPPGTRRRVRFAFQKIGGRMLTGFREAKSDRIVDVADCPVALPGIVVLLPGLREFLARHADKGEVAVTMAANGLDLVVFADREPGLDLRLDAPAFCEGSGVARLSWAAKGRTPEQLLALRAPRIRFGTVETELPPDAFLQPTAEGESILRGFVLEAVGDAARVLDLYAGCGAFALPLAAAGRIVHAVEGLAGQTRAIARAAPEVTTETRDLARQPLRRDELARFDAAILDPPRAGAREQVAELATSAVPAIVYVSCNPATFARDARNLIDAGYAVGRVLPVDQFLWSHHVELAATFRRR
ncbi:MAG: class I SAM-dependent RNA methyltransferase [Rhodospirillaceae bacterium]